MYYCCRQIMGGASTFIWSRGLRYERSIVGGADQSDPTSIWLFTIVDI